MNKNIEKMSDTYEKNIQDIITDIYEEDIQSIKNLGELSQQLQDSIPGLEIPGLEIPGLEIPGNFTINGNLTVDNDINIKGNMSVDNKITSNNLTVNDLTYTKRLNIAAKDGKTTHFNYDNKGETYFRDTVDGLGTQPIGNYVEKNKTFYIKSEKNNKYLQNRTFVYFNGTSGNNDTKMKIEQ